MFTVYALFSPKANKIFVGFTSDLEASLKSHNELGTKGCTIKFRPWVIFYREDFETKGQAMKRNLKLEKAVNS